jgi:hypothetical protein
MNRHGGSARTKMRRTNSRTIKMFREMPQARAAPRAAATGCPRAAASSLAPLEALLEAIGLRPYLGGIVRGRRFRPYLGVIVPRRH